MADPYEHELGVAIAAARAAGALLRQLHGRVRDVRYKGLVDLVTEADHASEALIAERLLRAFPTDRLLAEEGTGAGDNVASARRWIVDPLDGTTNYSHGHPVFAVSIALQVGAEIEVGVVFDPLRDELFTATRATGANLNGQPIQVSRTGELIRAMLATGFAYDVNRRLENLPFFARFTELSQAVRREGAAALDLCYVACGRFDAYWERGVSLWDVAASSLLVRCAGGTVGDYAGAPFSADAFTREVVASNAVLHERLLAVIAEVTATVELPAIAPDS